MILSNRTAQFQLSMAAAFCAALLVLSISQALAQDHIFEPQRTPKHAPWTWTEEVFFRICHCKEFLEFIVTIGLFGGLSTHGTGQFDKAIEASRAYLAAAPDFVFSYHNLASSYLFLDRFTEAESVLQQASARRVEEPYLMVLRYIIAALKGDKDQMAQVVTLAKGKHGAEHWVAHTEGLASARTGRLGSVKK
jgi:hypothetical protein